MLDVVGLFIKEIQQGEFSVMSFKWSIPALLLDANAELPLVEDLLGDPSRVCLPLLYQM